MSFCRDWPLLATCAATLASTERSGRPSPETALSVWCWRSTVLSMFSPSIASKSLGSSSVSPSSVQLPLVQRQAPACRALLSLCTWTRPPHRWSLPIGLHLGGPSDAPVLYSHGCQPDPSQRLTDNEGAGPKSTFPTEHRRYDFRSIPVYHLGAAAAFCRHGRRLLDQVQAFAGASAGSLVASVLLTAPGKIEVLLASSFVPLYAGLRPVEYNGQTWVDGALTNSLPILPVGRTVTISPFSGRKDVTPQDRGPPDLYITIAKQDIRLSMANLMRLRHALFPPDKVRLQVLQQHGFEDAVRFLRREHWFE
ncbi:patatin-like phospholipase domain-containing protein 4 [Echinops telfairi]|uniref:Patatin-like phospholipase domain-containing protein 4 n=1 Tax=Echinops telfairi TaxID=9371 RepID=A0AC55D4F3_ECHTE|nr:patatin-like phospholipase domain-containing protein 4 [Echinops telfairi]